MSLSYWKSLEELSESPEILEKLSKEFPGYDPDQIVSLSRRKFMKLMSASMALAGLTLNGCRRWPKQELAPYSSSPRDRDPGTFERYATVIELGGIGHGLLVTSYDGRPVKIEGNPSHPFASTFDGTIGASDAFAQASVLELYDPERSRGVINRNSEKRTASTWDAFSAAITPVLASLKSAGGKGLAFLSEASASPSVAAMRQRIQQVYPQAVWCEYEPLSRDNEIEGSQLAFGRPVRTRLNLDQANTIVSLDSDFLLSHPAHIRYANDWSKRRRSADEKGAGMVRMYMAESRLSITGAVADERIGVKPSRIPLIASALAAKIGLTSTGTSTDLTAEESRLIDAAAADLKRGGGVIVAAEDLSPEIHQLVLAMNDAIGAFGKTVTLLEEPNLDRLPIAKLVDQMKSGAVTSLVILGANPVYDAPADLGFGAAIGSVQNTVHLSLYENETSEKSHWHLPRAHYLESWGDARAWDGTLSIQQPLILPLYGGKSTIELLAMLTGDDLTAGDAIVRRTFATITGNRNTEAFRRVLHDGVLPESSYATVSAKPKAPGAIAPASAPASAEGFEVRFIADQKLYDGRFANLGWLQELPDSLSKLTWDNAALISIKDAKSLGIKNGDMVRLSVGDRSLDIAAFILPAQPIGVITLPLGYGRTAAGHIGNETGFNTYTLRTSANLHSAAGAKITRIAGTYLLAATQEHHLMDSTGFEGRQVRIGEKGHSGRIIHEASFAEYQRDPRAPHREMHEPVPLQLFNPPSQFNTPHAWGMAVDMTACIGCNACVTACQAENNIPVVGKDEVNANREMHWLRIDRYFKGEMEDPNPQIVFQPMMCVHCENAPCEQVCPVAATTHDSEGLNTMVYNRCIGTRYCSNNCPYKVRRFNYFDWHSIDPRGGRFPLPWLGIPDTQQQESIDKIKRMVFNPEVTVRMRGVMEKCTFCVQRVHNTEIAKQNANEPIKDGDIITACQQACPTEAIVFGNLNDPKAKVTTLHKNARAYSVLEDLNTRPRTRHLAKLRNPSPAPAGSGNAV